MNQAKFSFSGRRIPELDGIRGLAIVSVLIWHYGIGQIVSEPHSILNYALRMLGFTWSGVDLFFVLSGFLIGGILLDNKHSNDYFKIFYIRRVCRIFPLYFLWLALFAAISYGAAYFVIANRLNQIDWLFQDPLPMWSYLTFTQNITMAFKGDFGANWLGVTWSLAVEEQFYLLLPFIIYFLPHRRLPALLLFAICLAPLLRIALFMFHDHGGFSSYVLMPCRMDALLLGVLCAYMVRQESFFRYITERQKMIYTILAVSGLLILFMLHKNWSMGSLAMSSSGYSLLAVTYACVLLIAITEDKGLVASIARNKVLGKLGAVAYGIYIFHQAIFGLLHAALLKQIPKINGGIDVAVTCAALVLTLAISYLFWFYFEKGLVKLGHSFQYDKPKIPLEKVPEQLRLRTSHCQAPPF